MFTVQLQQFSGPLDLLVFFIQRDELDIYDIPIARITDEYLGFVRDLQQVDLDAAGEFVFFAALLIQIKAKMLLPNPEVDEMGEALDPRRELVERLLEYVRYKEASARLEALRAERLLIHTRPTLDEDVQTVEILRRMSAADLVRALRRVVVAAPSQVQHAVARIVYSVEQQMETLKKALARAKKVAFSSFTQSKPRGFVIASFLAVLELVRREQGQLRSGAGADFYIELRED